MGRFVNRTKPGTALIETALIETALTGESLYITNKVTDENGKKNITNKVTDEIGRYVTNKITDEIGMK